MCLISITAQHIFSVSVIIRTIFHALFSVSPQASPAGSDSSSAAAEYHSEIFLSSNNHVGNEKSAKEVVNVEGKCRGKYHALHTAVFSAKIDFSLNHVPTVGASGLLPPPRKSIKRYARFHHFE